MFHGREGSQEFTVKGGEPCLTSWSKKPEEQLALPRESMKHQLPEKLVLKGQGVPG